MAQSIAQRTRRGISRDVRVLLEAVLTDLAALRTQVAALQVDSAALDTALDALATKLNADAGVTDTNYAGAGTMTAAVPAALTLTA